MRLENEMTGRQVKTTIEAKEKAMVDHDVTKLEVKRVSAGARIAHRVDHPDCSRYKEFEGTH